MSDGLLQRTDWYRTSLVDKFAGPACERGGVRIALHTKAHIHLASVVVVVYVHV